MGYEKKEPIESGTTVDDVIEYVRRKMYFLTTKVITIDDDDEEDRCDAMEHELLKDLLNPDRKKSPTTTPYPKRSRNVETSNEKDGKDDDEDVEDNCTSTTTSTKLNEKLNDDEEYNDDDNDSDDDKKVAKKQKREDVYGNSVASDIDDDDDYVPDSYMFNSYFAYCLWGPFAPKEKQLTLFLLGKYYI